MDDFVSDADIDALVGLLVAPGLDIGIFVVVIGCCTCTEVTCIALKCKVPVFAVFILADFSYTMSGSCECRAFYIKKTFRLSVNKEQLFNTACVRNGIDILSVIFLVIGKSTFYPEIFPKLRPGFVRNTDHSFSRNNFCFLLV